MFGLVSLGKFFGFIRQPPDLINEDIRLLYISTKNIGVSPKDVISLANKIASSDGVAVSEGFHERFVESIGKRGSVQVMVSAQHIDSYAETLRSHPSVENTATYHWEVVKKYKLKELFPEAFPELHYCSNCDSQLKEEGAFCVNNDCFMAVQNLREANQELIEAGAMVEVLPDWRTKEDGEYIYHCHCHDVKITSDVEGDDVGEIRCPGCNDWIETYEEEEDDE